MWPSYVDASGCEKPIISGSSLEQITADSSLNVMDSKGNPISKSGKGGKESKALSSKMGTTNRDEDELEGTEIKKGRIPGWDDIHDDEKPKDAVHEGDAAPKLPPPKKQPQKDKLGDVEFIPLKRPDPLVFKVDEVKKEKRQLNDLNAKDTAESAPSDGPSTGSGKVSNIPVQIPSHKHDNGVATTTIYTEEQECLPQGLQSQNRWGTDDFTLGSLADSTYEYLPKMYLMLNGLVPQYKTMYENAINAAKEHLLFRAMIPDEKREILIAGSYSVTRNYGTNEDGTIKEKKILRTASSHLTCFVGGMFAMGSKLFDRKDDLQIAKKLTDGCVYAYEMTATGIMPETFHAIACDNRKSCPWNQTKWWAELDPDLGKWRESNYESSMKYYRAQVAARESAITDAKNKKTAAAAAEKISKAASTPESTTLRSHSDMEKRQLNVVDDDELEDNTPIQLTEADYDTRIKGIDYFEKAAQAQDKYEELQVAKQLEVAKASPTIDLGPESTWEPPTLTEDEDALPPIYSPEKPPTHKEFVKTMIKEDRLPPGIQSMGDRRYILR
jgi:mannosyl-oligosaccharide alpha-1,2-mannosidase